MKPLVQKLPIAEGSSFVARTYKTPLFETPWHQHEAVELVLQKCEGSMFIGDYIGEFSNGDVCLIGRNLPHWFRKKNERVMGNAVVVQFHEDLFGQSFLDLPEISKIKSLLLLSRQGILLRDKLKKKIRKQLLKIENLSGYEQLDKLMRCLHEISISNEIEILTNNYSVVHSEEEKNRIGKVFEYSFENFKETITLDEVAQLTNQSVSNFCKFFKKNTKKTYIQFLNEIRVSHACKLLKETDKTITEICYESGFRNWSNFSNQFKKVCGSPPKNYREKYSSSKLKSQLGSM